MADFEDERKKMVTMQIEARGVKDKEVLRVMKAVPRHLFVPQNLQLSAYRDEPLPIGEGQTISQPYIVAFMTEALQLKKADRVLEVGTGSGYQTAVLAELTGSVFTIEMKGMLAERAKNKLEEFGYGNIQFKIGDGAMGWTDYAPFDAVMVTAAPSKIPDALVSQLKVGGRMIIPVGDFQQDLVLVEKDKGRVRKKVLIPVRFVPLITES